MCRLEGGGGGKKKKKWGGGGGAGEKARKEFDESYLVGKLLIP